MNEADRLQSITRVSMAKGDLSMSLTGSLGSALATMGWAQLLCAMVATIAYAMALNDSLASRVRMSAAGVAFITAGAFSMLTPSWVSGVMLMMLAIAGVGAFAILAWLLAQVFGLRVSATETVVAPVPAFARGARSASALGLETIPHPL